MVKGAQGQTLSTEIAHLCSAFGHCPSVAQSFLSIKHLSALQILVSRAREPFLLPCFHSISIHPLSKQENQQWKCSEAAA